MDEELKMKKEQLKIILADARKAQKGSYNVYNYYSGRIFDIGLPPAEGDKAFRQLANILRV